MTVELQICLLVIFMVIVTAVETNYHVFRGIKPFSLVLSSKNTLSHEVSFSFWGEAVV